MKGDIDRDFYCSVGGVQMGEFEPTACNGRAHNVCPECSAYHRKWPTPEQYKEEYGGEYPEDGAVYLGTWQMCEGVERWIRRKDWTVMDLYSALSEKERLDGFNERLAKEYKPEVISNICAIVCTCTPGASPLMTGGRNDNRKRG
jgi:hypothetical protein